MAEGMKEILNKKLAIYTAQFDKKLSLLTQNLIISAQENQALISKIEGMKSNLFNPSLKRLV